MSKTKNQAPKAKKAPLTPDVQKQPKTPEKPVTAPSVQRKPKVGNKPKSSRLHRAVPC